MVVSTQDDQPWWVKALGAGLGLLFAGGLVWLISELSKFVEFKPLDTLDSGIQAQLGKKNILILGSRCSGKTALLWYMEHKRPYRLDGTRAIGPDQTLAAVLVGKDFKINRDKWTRVAKDVGGDQLHLWHTVIEEVRPSGLVYMLNPTEGADSFDESRFAQILQKEIAQIRDHVLEHYRRNRIPLQAFHVFLNFADKWAEPTRERRIRRQIEDELDNFMHDSHFSNTRVDVAVTQLAPDRTEWKEVANAIDHFGADLGRD